MSAHNSWAHKIGKATFENTTPSEVIVDSDQTQQQVITTIHSPAVIHNNKHTLELTMTPKKATNPSEIPQEVPSFLRK